MIKEKIIFLDIDGVSLTGINHLEDRNKKLFSSIKNDLKEKNPSISNYDINKEYSKKAYFDETAISLLNRLADKTGAKFVLITNWRRNIGIEETLNVLTEKGFKKEFFHEKYSCPMKMSSDKISDLYFWMCSYKKSRSEIEKANIKFIVIDDDDVLKDNQVFTDYQKGFTLNDYRLACLMLEGTDKTLGVITLPEEELKEVYTIFNKDNKTSYREMCKWLAENPKGFNTSRSCLLSKEIAEDLSKETSIFFKTESKETLFKSRSENIFNEIEEIKQKKLAPKGIYLNTIKILDDYDINIVDLPEVPCIVIKEDRGDGVPEFLTAPSDVDGISYLKGCLEMLSKK